MLSGEVWRALAPLCRSPKQPWQRSLELEVSVGQPVPFLQLHMHREHGEETAPKPRDTPAAPQKQTKIMRVLKSSHQPLHADVLLGITSGYLVQMGWNFVGSGLQHGRKVPGFFVVGSCVPPSVPPSAGDLQGRRLDVSRQRGLEDLRSISCTSLS